jgi:transcriptional regulator with XRE-family HTH domain
MLDKELLEEIQIYIEKHFLFDSIRESLDFKIEGPILDEMLPYNLDDYIEVNKKPALQQLIFEYIDNKGITDAEIYKKAGMDRRHFSKIRSNPDYRPKKTTIIALAIALELSEKEADRLLNTAGYSLSESEEHDLIIKYFLEKEIYDLHQVNQVLDHYSLRPLGGVLT